MKVKRALRIIKKLSQLELKLKKLFIELYNPVKIKLYYFNNFEPFLLGIGDSRLSVGDSRRLV